VHHRYIAAHTIAATLCRYKPPSLAVLHAFTGSDTPSFWADIGKRTGWKTWDGFLDVTDAFSLLDDAPSSILDGTFEVQERCVVLLYEKHFN